MKINDLKFNDFNKNFLDLMKNNIPVFRTSKDEQERLQQLARQSADYTKQVQEKNIFKSNTLPRIMTDRYDYQGDKSDTICVIDRRTGEPCELTVEVNQYTMPMGVVYEEYNLVDKSGEIIGFKNFSIGCDSYLHSYYMKTGSMDNSSKDLIGVGARLDQIHVERAMELGINKIPRFAVFTGLLYHLKMGFLPDNTEDDIGFTKISKEADIYTHIEEMNKELKQYKNEYKHLIPRNLKLMPIVVQNANEYFLDLKQTAVYLGFALSENIMKNADIRRMGTKFIPKGAIGKGVHMNLSGEQLKHWQELIKGHEILPKLTHLYI